MIQTTNLINFLINWEKKHYKCIKNIFLKMENKKIKIYSQKYDQVYLLKEIFLISRIDIFKEKKKVFAHRIWI